VFYFGPADGPNGAGNTRAHRGAIVSLGRADKLANAYSPSRNVFHNALENGEGACLSEQHTDQNLASNGSSHFIDWLNSLDQLSTAGLDQLYQPTNNLEQHFRRFPSLDFFIGPKEFCRRSNSCSRQNAERYPCSC
jgi:hypothetical protein